MSLRGILFDLYGTLLVYGNMTDAWSDWLSTFYDLLKSQGLNLPKDNFALECDGFFSKDEQPGGENDLTELECRIKSLGRRLNLELHKDQLRPIADTIANAWQTHISIDPDAIPILSALKKNKMLGLVSNFDHPPHVRRILSNHGLESFFDTIIISSEVGVKKPDPAIFMIALEQTGLSQDEVVYVGDTDEDVAGAIAAGIQPIFIARAAHLTDRAALDFRVANGSEGFPKRISSKNEITVIKNLQEVLHITTHNQKRSAS
ncbi:MAG: HAD family hydrolase [Desulfobacterales bacterium]|jgi:putative hydrolase of the HAD superfamily